MARRQGEANLQAHGVSFDLAKTVFEDPLALSASTIAKTMAKSVCHRRMAAGGVVLFVAFTEREGRMRIVSARRATQMSKTTTSGRTASPPRPMTPEAIERAARADPDAQPLTDADLMRMRRTPRTKVIRRALDLTQEEFAARYHIPLGTLRDWEQGRTEPDNPRAPIWRSSPAIRVCEPGIEPQGKLNGPPVEQEGNRR